MPPDFNFKTCPHCGNNPVPHLIYWYFESLNIAFSPLRRALLFNPISRLIKKFAVRTNLAWHLARLGRFLKILSVQPELGKCKVSRAKVLWLEAEKRGIKMAELLLFGRPFDVYVAWKKEIPNLKIQKKPSTINHQSPVIFSGLPRPNNYDDSSIDWMDDKWLFKKKMAEHNLPVPQGRSVSNLRQALKTFNGIQAKAISLPVIVKPRAGSRGRHSTTFVTSESDLKQAFKIAKKLCFWVIVEEQLIGPVYRATLINYGLCGVLRGDPPQIVGDGAHGIKALIDVKNQQPHPGVKDIIIDEAMERFIQRQNPKLGLDYVPLSGEIVNLSEKIGVNYGGSSSEDFEICHPDNKTLFIRAAKILGDPIVGFDFIIPDIARSWREQKCGFIEANSLPFINLHHDPLTGRPRNVAAKVWEMMEM